MDHAGNISQQATYSFYAPSDPNPPAPVPGDITGDGKVDVLVVDATGALKGYSAATTPASGGVLISGTNDGSMQTPTFGYTWTGALFGHRAGSGLRDDLFAYNGSSLSVYRNTGGSSTDGAYFARNKKIVVNRPSRCFDPSTVDGRCVSFKNDWSQVKQLVPGDDADGDGLRDLFTVEQDTAGIQRLWLHTGGSFGNFFKLILLDQADRSNQEFSSPGDINGDGLADLWARDRTDGKLYQYASAKNPDGTADLGAYSRTPTLIATGFDTAAYPQVSSDGDFDGDGDGKADLWARAANGNVYTFPGQAPDTNGNVFGPAQLIAGS